jgi:cytochrome P450 / NADPH-cytochrome P450 reductase
VGPREDMAVSFGPIPQPHPAPLVGNLPSLDPSGPVQGLMKLAQEHGPVFLLELPGRPRTIVVSSQRLVHELCDETRFEKQLHQPLRQVREFAGDGLFTAETGEHNWELAHRILMPAFGPAALRAMFDGMVDVAEQLLLKWERLGPDHVIDVADNATRLTLDTIALCSFGYRFNSFYGEQLHPFVGAMVRALSESGLRSRRLPLQNRLMLLANRQFAEDRSLMYSIADRLIADRRRHPSPPGHRDILDTMLAATDPKTGERLPAENVRYQLVTFLIAGHETTSGLLTFTFYELLRNPGVLARARALVDEVLGGRRAGFADLAELGYLDRILRETLRLWPTAPAFALTPLAEETTLGGRYQVRRGDTLLVLAPMLHRDPAVWDEPERFDPDRFEFERAEALPPQAWKPFGNGVRSCIGRGFALQEAQLFLAMLLQRFDLAAADPHYTLAIHETLTMKPEGFTMRVRRRPGVVLDAAGSGAQQAAAEQPELAAATGNGVPVRVLFGSNSGTCEAFAQRIANDTRRRGYSATLDTLDSAAGHLPTEGFVVIVTSSYEGQPPDNARRFTSWLDSLGPGSLRGVRYAVFGCGNKDWARTYQAVPKLVDARLAAAGAERILDRGEANARGDFFGDFDSWYDRFWPAVGTALGQATDEPAPSAAIEVAFVGAVRDPLLRANGLALGTVVANRELTSGGAPAGRSKRHVEVALPEGMTYQAGDYLAVLPLNPAAVVDRALSRFDLSYDAQVVLRFSGVGDTYLPTGQPISTGELLSSYVELSAPAGRRQIEQLADTTACPPERDALRALVADEQTYTSQVLDRRVSVLDLLIRHPSVPLPLGAFLQMLPPLSPRQYSISSSPRWSSDHVTLTVAVLSAPARSGSGTYEGAASTYLAGARPGSRVAVSVRPSNIAFHPPQSLGTPVVMVAAGSGIAPFRGFVQDRALRAAAEGTAPAPALLFFGCDRPDSDLLYRDEIAGWERAGAVSLRPAFSDRPQDGVRFVQDRLWADRADVVDLVRRGAVFYVCGDGRRMAPAVYQTCQRIYQEATGATAEDAEAWIADMQRNRGRYVADVFA